MNIGTLRHRITLQQPATTTNDYGEEIVTWQDVATVWAFVQAVSLTALSGAKEFIGGGAEVSQDVIRVVMRPREVGADWRFTFRGAIYDIKAVRPNNENDQLTLLATVTN